MMFSKEFTEFHRILFDEAAQPMWLFDPSTLCFFAVNEAMTKVYGYYHSELMRMSIVDIRPYSDMPHVLENIQNLQFDNFEHVVVEQWRHKTKNEDTLEVQLQAQSVLYNGKLLRLVQVLEYKNLTNESSVNWLSHNAHKHPNLEKEKQKSLQAQRLEEKSILDSLLRNSPDPSSVMRYMLHSMRHYASRNDLKKLNEYFPLVLQAQQYLLGIQANSSITRQYQNSEEELINTLCNPRSLVLSVFEQQARIAEEQGFYLEYELPSRELLMYTDVECVRTLVKLFLSSAFTNTSQGSVIYVQACEGLFRSQDKNLHSALHLEFKEVQSAISITSAKEIIHYSRTPNHVFTNSDFFRILSEGNLEIDEEVFNPSLIILRLNIYTACCIVQRLGGNVTVESTQETLHSPLIFTVDLPLNFLSFSNTLNQ